MSALVELVRIDKRFPGTHALRGVDLCLRAGTIHALVGENGAGKSTLINILSGVLHPDAGEVRIGGQHVRLDGARAAWRQGIVTVYQEVDLFPDLSVLENVAFQQGFHTSRLGWISWSRQRQSTQAALHTIGDVLAPDQLAADLTPAQRQLVEIAAAVSRQTRVLVLDEPTSSLSEAETHLLFEHLRRLKAQGAALLYVSHRFDEIFALADEVTVLRDGRRVWSGPIAATSPPDLLRLMVGREVTYTALPQGREPGAARLICRSLTAADGSCRDVSMAIHAGEVVGLYGLIGAGRSEWAQTVFGLRRLAAGELFVDGRPVVPRSPDSLMHAGVAYAPEDRLRQGLCRGLSVRANLVLASLRRLAGRLGLSTARENAAARPLVERLGIRLRSLEQPAGTLSGGNQQKVVLGRWLECEPRVLILDEPTRGVDVGAKVEIHALIQRLADEGRAVVLISSDLPEVVSQSDRVGVFRDGRLIGFFDPRQATPEEIAAAAMPEEKPLADRKAKEATPARSPASGRRPAVRELSLLAIVLAFLGLVHLRTGDFLAPGNLRGLLTDTALLSFCAIGAALVLLVGALDISLGALMALSAGLAGQLWEQGQPWPVVALVAATLGALGGTLNASLSLVGRVHPIVVTLGTLSIYRGLTLWWLGQDVQVAGSLRNRAFERIGGLPLVVWVGLGVVVLAWLFLTRTVLGRSFYALGSNPAAAHRAGIDRPRIWLGAFALQGILAGLAGFLYLARSGNVQPTSFEDKTLEAIAAAVLGGVAITGGRGSVWGVLLGCLFLVSLAPAATQLHVSTSWQRTLVGGVLTVAVLLDTLWRRKRA